MKTRNTRRTGNANSQEHLPTVQENEINGETPDTRGKRDLSESRLGTSRRKRRKAEGQVAGAHEQESALQSGNDEGEGADKGSSRGRPRLSKQRTGEKRKASAGNSSVDRRGVDGREDGQEMLPLDTGNENRDATGRHGSQDSPRKKFQIEEKHISAKEYVSKVEGNSNRDDRLSKKSAAVKKGAGKTKVSSTDILTDGHESADEEDEEDIWEEVLPTSEESTDQVRPEGVTNPPNDDEYKTIEITFQAPKVNRPKSSGVSRMQRFICEQTHMTHLLCLLGNGMTRNKWCNDEALRGFGLSLVPPKIYNYFYPRTRSDDDDPLVRPAALRELASWWTEYFTITGPGIVNGPWVPDSWEHLKNAEERVDPRQIITSPKDMIDRLVQRNGDRDTSAQLFVAVCRALGMDTRLVFSLQPISFKARSMKEKDEDNEGSPITRRINKDGSKSQIATTSKKECTRTPGRNRKPRPEKVSTIMEENEDSDQSNVSDKSHSVIPPSANDIGPPIFWAEVWSPQEQKWLCVDAVGVVDGTKRMNPGEEVCRSLAPNDKCTGNVMAYVVAYERGGGLKDVTRRYATQWGAKTKKLRLPVSKNKPDWWEETIQPFLVQDGSPRAAKEDAELSAAEISETMPTTISAFNNHPLYALERHLKKFEILHPMEPVLGTIRNEKVYPRSCVQTCHTVETWLKEGRSIKSRAVTMNTKRAINMSQLGEAPDVGVYGEWQTEIYRPPPIVNGKVPKNNYSNIDLFQPWMLPEGATHIPINGTGKIAKRLGIDYADAVVGFEFHSRRCVPTLQGIVVPTEAAEFILEAYREFEAAQQQKQNEKREKEELTAQRLHDKKREIEERLAREYVTENFEDPEEESLPSADEAELADPSDAEDTEVQKSSSSDAKRQPGGFIIENDDTKDENSNGGKASASRAPKEPRSFAFVSTVTPGDQGDDKGGPSRSLKGQRIKTHDVSDADDTEASEEENEGEDEDEDEDDGETSGSISDDDFQTPPPRTSRPRRAAALESREKMKVQSGKMRKNDDDFDDG